MLIIITILVYFLLLIAYSRIVTGRRSDNDVFFRAGRKSPWYMVAFGMVGASISGVTFVSVPGMVNTIGMTYMQTCLGFILGYVLVAFVLLPIYYKYNLITIYSYLEQRLGSDAYKTGASFFLVSKMIGAAVRFYVVCMILQRFVLDALGIPFIVTVVGLVFCIWIYTRRGGIKTLVWTDTLQTVCMLAALTMIVAKVVGALDMSFSQAVTVVVADERSRWFVFDDPVSKQYFWKQFLSGIFIVIVMTGLDQDMMQKNLTCKSLRDAQKDMCTYGVAFVPVNLLFLFLGVLLSLLCQKEGLPMPVSGDELLPMFAASGRLGESVVVLLTIGIVAASFSSADSALTSMTTSYCIDIRGKADDEAFRKKAHVVLAIVFGVIILVVNAAGSRNIIDVIYTICGYTYGPLLGLFVFARFMGNKKATPRGGFVWAVCVLSPLLCFLLNSFTSSQWDYNFGYELLMVNGVITFVGLLLIQKSLSLKSRHAA